MVQRGDTLSGIVHGELQASGRTVSSAELYDRVRDVARANNLADPDVIDVGQRIDLSVLDGRGGLTTRNRQSGQSPVPVEPTSSSLPMDLHRIVPGKSRISSHFGPRQDPFDGEIREHRGVDIAARRGTPIYPANDGTVVYAGWHGGHGKTVIVRHEDGSETLYAHADTLLVGEGDRVDTGDKLGLVGSTGRSTGPHLHFEVRRNGVAIDPLAALGHTHGAD